MIEKTENPEQQIVEPEEALPRVTLDNLPTIMTEAVERVGWTELMPVQSYAIPYLRQRRDLMVQARTGSGKTGAFILPILERIDPNKKTTQALILVPTRELAQQVTSDAKDLAGKEGPRAVAVYGGTSYKPQLEAFKKGAHLVVGTPGRVLDHLIKRNLVLDDLEILVFDEADRMMSMGFYPDMVRVQEFLPDSDYNAYMFSATIPIHVKRLANQFLDDPGFLSLSRDTVHVEDTDHYYYMMPGMEKDRALVRIIELENPHQAIIFCNTKDRVFYVTRVLQRFGYNADLISSDLSQKDRDTVLNRLRHGELRFLVATDVAARGLDIPELSHVFQYEPPEDVEGYIHRAGRTGRAGASGVSILLVGFQEKKWLSRIAGRYGIEFIEQPVPDDEDVQSIVAQRLVGHLEAKLRERDRLKIERMQRFMPLVEELASNEDGRALLAQLLDDAYHEWMHNPPELPPVGSKSSSRKRRDRSHKKSGRKRRR
jgi:ATP-dependent RNA helicase DeaD